MIDLDTILDPAKAAEWLGLKKPALLRLAREGKIPAIKLNARVFRFHPRTILTAALLSNGVARETVEAALRQETKIKMSID